jgi:hypothetical protein
MCALVGVSGCGAGAEDAWARAAEDWIAPYDASWGIGFSNAAAFYAEDVRVDQRSLSWYSGVGSADFIRSTRDVAQEVPTWLGGRDTTGAFEEPPNEPVHVSVDDARLGSLSRAELGEDFETFTCSTPDLRTCAERAAAPTSSTGNRGAL